MAYLYKLDFASGKSYIGQTIVPIAIRMYQHKCRAKKGGDGLIHRAWRKYGEPKVTIIASMHSSLLRVAEIEAITRFNTLVPNGYNMTPGGDSNPMLIPEIARKSALAKMGRKRPDMIGANNPAKRPEVRAKISDNSAMKRPEIAARFRGENNPMKRPEVRAKFIGRKHSLETRLKMSANHKMHRLEERLKMTGSNSPLWGKHRTAETRAKIAAAHRGKKASAETRAKLSIIKKGRPLSETHRIALAEANKKSGLKRRGVKLSSETKAKMSAARKAFLKRKRNDLRV